MNYSSLGGAGRTRHENQAPSDQQLPLLQGQPSSRFLEEPLHLLISSVAFQARVTALPWAPAAAAGSKPAVGQGQLNLATSCTKMGESGFGRRCAGFKEETSSFSACPGLTPPSRSRATMSTRRSAGKQKEPTGLRHCGRSWLQGQPQLCPRWEESGRTSASLHRLVTHPAQSHASRHGRPNLCVRLTAAAAHRQVPHAGWQAMLKHAEMFSPVQAALVPSSQLRRAENTSPRFTWDIREGRVGFPGTPQPLHLFCSPAHGISAKPPPQLTMAPAPEPFSRGCWSPQVLLSRSSPDLHLCQPGASSCSQSCFLLGGSHSLREGVHQGSKTRHCQDTALATASGLRENRKLEEFPPSI